MKLKKLTLFYVSFYLFLGGFGLAIIPETFLKLFLSTGNYGDIMPRVGGMFMIVLGGLVYRIVRYEDYKYYPLSILIRSGIVLFLFFLYFRSDDPFFLLINIIVLAGLLPSMIIYLRDLKQKQ